MFSHSASSPTRGTARPLLRPGLASIRRHAKTAIVGAVLLGATVFAILALRGPVEGTPVLVSSQDITGGGPVPQASVRVVLLPSDAVPDNVLQSPDELDGLIATQDVGRGTVLTFSHLADETLVPDGYSRLTIPLHSDRSDVVSGEVVEIWGPLPTCVEMSCPVRLLASGVRVISVSDENQGLLGENSGAHVTLLASSADISSILHASESSSVHFVIPSPTSTQFQRRTEVLPKN